MSSRFSTITRSSHCILAGISALVGGASARFCVHRRDFCRIGVFLLLITALVFGDCLALPGAVRLPAVISDGMVLQRNQPNPIWGWATPGGEVAVSIAGQTVKTTADKDGRFRVAIGPVAAGGPYELAFQESAGPPLTVKGVLVGEVWLCSGQSNMWWSVARARDAGKVAAAANYPAIRFFAMSTSVADAPKDNCDGKWIACSPQSVPDFSAVAYEFLRQLHEQLKLPCGMLQCTIGGAPAEAWTDASRLAQVPCIQPLLERWKQGKAAPNDAIWRPGGLYNGTILPLVPYGIRGFIWYQGESNSARAFQYREMFPLLIANWREIWGNKDMPFGFVQIAPYNYPVPPHHNWEKYVPELRQSQLETWKKVPNTGMVVTTDIGDPNDIHPANKQEVGRRLSLWAMSQVYGKQGVVYSGPVYRSMSTKDGRVRLQFDHLGSGLLTRDGKAPSCFTIAGPDQEFVPAQAAIDGAEVVVWAPALTSPVAVRYGWCHHAEPNLCNKEGLPASPFRTDDWKWLTEANN